MLQILFGPNLRLVGLVFISVSLCPLHHLLNLGLRQLSSLVCDGDAVGLALGRHVQALLPSVVGLVTRSHVLPPRVARGQHRSHTLRTLCVEVFALVRLLLAMLFLSWVLGSQPWLFSSWVLGPQSQAVCIMVLGSQAQAVFLSSRPFGTCFIKPLSLCSVECALLTPWLKVSLEVHCASKGTFSPS